MHIVPKHVPSITLFHESGASWRFPSLRAALRELGYAWIARKVGPEFRQFGHLQYCFGGWPEGEGWIARRHDPDVDVGARAFVRPTYGTASFVMRDDTGRTITENDFWQFRPRRKRKGEHRAQCRDASYPGYGPVPGTGRRYGGTRRISYTRRCHIPQTFNERRLGQQLDELEPPVRVCRQGWYLPDDRYEWYRSDQKHRCWKQQRRHQWKEVA